MYTNNRKLSRYEILQYLFLGIPEKTLKDMNITLEKFEEQMKKY
jgi:hypothetical protein